MDSSTSDNVSEEGKLTDTAVLDLSVTEFVETLLGSIAEEVEGVKESDGRLYTELRLERRQSNGRGCLLRSRRESRGRTGKKRCEEEFHFSLVEWRI
mmetsp:Transcript_2541/g.4861  ORF Transcript_2541/g.4861 Transcript_2541/m.4861 type:complete len:97 (-) Transcript_2541:146-436(-)